MDRIRLTSVAGVAKAKCQLLPKADVELRTKAGVNDNSEADLRRRAAWRAAQWLLAA
jgi:hypothetical protein